MSERKISRLTKAEEQVMQILWDHNEALIKELVEGFGIPKPAYTTVATVLKVLEKKNFVSHRVTGNTHIYRAEVSKTDYSKFQLSNLLANYFNGSFPKMATFFARENDISIEELEEIMKEANKNPEE